MLVHDINGAEHIKGSEAREENGKWKHVQDFCWLKSTPSPNWYALASTAEDVLPTLLQSQGSVMKM